MSLRGRSPKQPYDMRRLLRQRAARSDMRNSARSDIAIKRRLLRRSAARNDIESQTPKPNAESIQPVIFGGG